MSRLVEVSSTIKTRSVWLDVEVDAINGFDKVLPKYDQDMRS